MKFICVSEKLAQALSLAERFTGKSITLPILGNILLEVRKGVLFITATNLEYGIRIALQGKESQDGRVSVPAKIISPFIQSLKGEKLELESSQSHLVIKTNGRATKVNGSSANDFPLLPSIKKAFSFILRGGALQRAVEQVIPAVSTSEFKQEFTGVFCSLSGNALHLVATDTFRLGEKKITLLKKPESGFTPFIIPRAVIQEVARAFSQEDEIIVSFGDNQITFESDGIYIISRIIDGTFPNYTGIIPKEFGISCFVGRNELKDALKAAGIFASKLSDVTLTFNSKKLTLRAANPDIGEYHTDIPIKAEQTKGEIQTSFNIRYLLDGVNALSEEEIFFGCNATDAPSLIHDKEDGTFLYVVMPIRLT